LRSPFVKGCHYQDVACRRSLCLRGHHSWALGGFEGEAPSVFYCTEQTIQRCPHRAWDHDVSVGVQQTRARLLTDCPSCGHRHHRLDERMRCILLRSIDDKFATSGKECGGSCEQILPSGVPQEMAPYAWKKIRAKVLERDERKCRSCHRDLDDMPSWFFEVHHVVPRSEGGSDHPANLITLCYICHKKVTARAGSPEREDPRQLANGRL